jgi:integrase
MPRSKGIPAYCLHKHTGQARVRLDGQDVYLGVHGSDESRRKYEELVRKLITERAARELKARVEIATDLTINELALSYIERARTYYVKRGRTTPEFGNVCLAIKAVRERHGHELVTAFGPLKLKAIRDQWIAKRLVRAQINARVDRVRRMFAWGVEEELVPPAVLQALGTVKGLREGRCAAKEGRKVTPVPDGHVDAVRPFVSRQVWTMIELQRLTGMRPGEVAAMRTLDIKMAGDVWEYRPAEHKTEHVEKDRVIHIGPRAREVLGPWLRSNLEEYLFQPKEAKAERAARMRAARKTPVQPSQRNRRKTRPRRAPAERYTKDSYARAIARACEKAGVPHWAPNRLRHGLGTRVRHEMGLEAAQVVLGHSKADVTQVYAERNQQLAREAMARLG